MKEGRDYITTRLGCSKQGRRMLLTLDSVALLSFSSTLFLLFSDLKKTFGVGAGDVDFLVWFRPLFSLLLAVLMLSLGLARAVEDKVGKNQIKMATKDFF